MAERVGDAATAAKATYQLGIRRWWEGRWDEALRLLDHAGQTAVECGDAFVEVEAARFRGVVLVSAGQVDDGLAAQMAVLRRIEGSRRNEVLVTHVRMYLGHCRRHIGDDDTAIVDLEAARSGFEHVGNTASLIHVCAGLAELYADRDQPDRALARAAEALRIATEGNITTYHPWVLCTVARIHAIGGDVDSARAAIDRAVSSLDESWIGEIHRVAVELAAATAHLGDFEATARLIGVADANEDRRELPFRTPLEPVRLAQAVDAAQHALGDRYEALRRRGATSTVAEALGSVS
jgi:tetratricopeptide (TPR) repeat protein